MAGTVAGGAAPVLPSWAYPPGDAPPAARDRRTTAILGAVLAALVVAALIIGVAWWRGEATTPSTAVSAPTPSATASTPTSASAAITTPTSSGGASTPATSAPAPPATVTVVTTTAVPGVPQAPATVTVTAAPTAPPTLAAPTTPAPAPSVVPVPAPDGRGFGDLGLSTPISTVGCTGTPIVLYSSAITPGAYAADVQTALDDHPGASYLRTDQACSSLKQSVNGNAIYAVFRAYSSTNAACAAEGDSASFRLLDNGSPDTSTFTC